MKKGFTRGLIGIFVIFVVFIFFAGKTFSGTTKPGVSGTPHDLTYTTGPKWQYNTNEVCVFCHTPHQGSATAVPLWNKTLPPATYTMYTSSSFDMGPSSALGSPSILCMSCHDGTMAINAVVNAPGRGSANGGVITPYPGTTATKLSQVAPTDKWVNISGSSDAQPNVDNLADDHPVSFVYNPAVDLQSNNFPGITVAGGLTYISGATTTAKYPLFGYSGVSNRFECSTCHDVHDTSSYATKDTSEIFFLRTSNAKSSMCRDCHPAKYQ